MKNYKKIIVAAILPLLWMSFAVAADTNLPEMMVGQAKVLQGGVNFYGGFTGNEVVYNYPTVNGQTFSNGQSMQRKLGPSIETSTTSPVKHVRVPSSTSLKFGHTFTLESWINPTSCTGNTIIAKSYTNYHTLTNYQDSYVMWLSARDANGNLHSNRVSPPDSSSLNTTCFLFANVGNATSQYTGSYVGLWKGHVWIKDFPINIGWHHVALTLDTDKNLRLYLDGDLVSNQPDLNQPKAQVGTNPTTGNIDYDDDPIWIGADSNSPGDGLGDSQFEGNLDEVRVYDKALNSDQIKEDIKGNYDNTDKSMKGYWDFSEGQGTIAGDRTDYNNDGTLYQVSAGSPRVATAVSTLWDKDNFPIATITSSTPASANDNLIGFDKYYLQDPLSGCINDVIFQHNLNGCYFLNVNSSTQGLSVSSGKTYVNSTPATETAVLFYPQKMVMGDVYGSMNNFAFWGKNLHQQASGDPQSDATWKLGGYPINDNAQAKWNGTEFQKNASKINTLKGEAPLLNTTDTGQRSTGWLLQSPTDGASSLLDGPTNSDTSKYPEGKVWRISGAGVANNLVVSANVTYSGVGTIIVDGNLTINDGKNITPSTSSDRLGFIVNGTVTITGNNKIQASIYCPGTINVGTGNNELTGSFVASNFTINSANARFFYDYALDSAWPPGFRYLNMPHPSETKQ